VGIDKHVKLMSLDPGSLEKWGFNSMPATS